MSCIFVQIPHCFRRYGKLHEVVFKWVTTEGAARCAVRGSVVRAEKPRNISGSRAPGKTSLASTFFPTYHRILKWCKFSCNFATSDRSVHLGTVPAHLVYILPKVLPLNKAIDWNLTWSSWSLLANRPFVRRMWPWCGFCWPTKQASIWHPETQENPPPNATTPQKMKALLKVYEALHCLSIIPDH